MTQMNMFRLFDVTLECLKIIVLREQVYIEGRVEVQHQFHEKRLLISARFTHEYTLYTSEVYA